MWGQRPVSDHADGVIHQAVEAYHVGRSGGLSIGDQPPAVRERRQRGIDDRAADGFQHHVDGGAIVGLAQPVGESLWGAVDGGVRAEPQGETALVLG